MCVLNTNSELFTKQFNVTTDEINNLLSIEHESDITYCLRNDIRSKKLTDTELDYLLNSNFFCKCDHTYTQLHACIDIPNIPYECDNVTPKKQ